VDRPSGNISVGHTEKKTRSTIEALDKKATGKKIDTQKRGDTAKKDSWKSRRAAEDSWGNLFEIRQLTALPARA